MEITKSDVLSIRSSSSLTDPSSVNDLLRKQKIMKATRSRDHLLFSLAEQKISSKKTRNSAINGDFYSQSPHRQYGYETARSGFSQNRPPIHQSINNPRNTIRAIVIKFRKFF